MLALALAVLMASPLGSGIESHRARSLMSGALVAQEAEPVPAQAIAMTGWSFTTGGLNFQLIGGSFASACDGQLMLDNTSGGSDLYSNTWNDLTTVGPIVITGLTVGANYVLYVRAWTGETGWESLPWVQYGTQWTQPSKSADPIEQEE